MKQEQINKLAKEKFENGMRKNLPHIKYNGYIRSAQNMNCECSICGHKWLRSPNQFYRENKWKDCPNCVRIHSKYQSDNVELRRQILNKYPNMNILTKVIKTKRDSILFTFDDKDTLYQMHISQLLKDGKRTFVKYWDTNVYKTELKKVNSNIECKESFVNFTTKILHHCKIHNIDFYIDPTHSLRGQGCSQCKLEKIGNAKRKSTGDYIKQLHNKHPNIDLNGKYISGKQSTPHICRNCGFEWNPYPINLLKRGGCPVCEKTISLGEQKIIFILKKHKITYFSQFRFDDCRNKYPLPFDFYIPDKNACIEFQGKQHYEPAQFGGITIEEANNNLKGVKKRDLIKSIYCKNNYINLILIPYWDFNNIEEILDREKILT